MLNFYDAAAQASLQSTGLGRACGLDHADRQASWGCQRPNFDSASQSFAAEPLGPNWGPSQLDWSAAEPGQNPVKPDLSFAQAGELSKGCRFQSLSNNTTQNNKHPTNNKRWKFMNKLRQNKALPDLVMADDAAIQTGIDSTAEKILEGQPPE